MIRPFRWHGDRLELLDQRLLPHRCQWVSCIDAGEVAGAIRKMVIRGAPAIGVAAAYGLVLEAKAGSAKPVTTPELIERLEQGAEALAAARPTAVNLFWAIARMRQLWTSVPPNTDPVELAQRLERLAQEIDRSELDCNLAIGRHGAPLLAGVKAVLTHCNTGALATSGYGTALGVIKAAHERHPLHVYACETRPYLQGSRLTVWELQQERIPVTLIVDSAAHLLMRAGRVQAVVVGADRIAGNGDVANKIGSYGLALSAHCHGIPFYVAAPRSTVDLGLETGEDIEIEFRAPEEVTHIAGQPVAPEGTEVWNPAFDVTPADLVTAIITEAGVIRPPFRAGLERIMESAGNVGHPGGGTVA